MMRGALLLLTLAAASGPHLSAQGSPSLQSLEQRAVADSNDPVAHYELGRAYFDRQRYDEAERRWQVAVTLAPQYAQAYLALAILPQARGENYWKHAARERGDSAVTAVFSQSTRFFQRAFLIDPLVDLSLLPRAEEKVSISIGGKNYFVWWAFPLSKGINELRTGRFQAAVNRFTGIINDDRSGPESSYAPEPAYWYRALAAARLGNYAMAVEDCWLLVQRLVKHEEEEQGETHIVPLLTNQYRFLLATMLYLDNRYDQAIPVFRRTLEFDGGLYQSHIQIARMHEAASQWEQALVERRAAIAINPDDASLMVDLGATLIRAGNTVEAGEVLKAAANAAPRDARAWYLLGQVEAGQHHAEGAREAYRRFLAIAPSRFQQQREEVRALVDQLPQ
jgi:tetratricopeptide (TPR) repeat protein